MEYDIKYEHLEDELVTNPSTSFNFKNVRNSANKHRLELSDDDFKRFFKLSMRGKDIDWLMLCMSQYNTSLTDALISYMCY